ncbi:InlB B-repeat-containing protein [Candidatus Saccharibacteria bacterium]|nr:InlB B-repeat-containing protein [Candidatus Saccharibacteria bacterium]
MATVFGASVSALDLSQESIEIVDKSSTTIVHDAGIGNLSITPNLEFNRLGDFISYKLVIKNNDGRRYRIVDITDDNANEAIALTYLYPAEMDIKNKEIEFTVKYIKTTDLPLKTINVVIKIVDEDDASEEIPIVIPNTGANTSFDTVSAVTAQSIVAYIAFAAICCAIYIIVRRKKTKVNVRVDMRVPKVLLGMALLLGILPVAVIAASFENVYFTVYLTEVKLNGPYIVAFDTGEGGTELPVQVVNNGDLVSRPTSSPTKEGYNFVDWVDENGDPYDFNTPITGPVTISAKWQPITYTITYEPGDDATDPATMPTNPEEYTVESSEIILANPTRDHYNFAGWTGEDLSGPTMEVKIPTGSIGNRVYTATWTEKEYTASFDTKGGTPDTIESQTRKYKETFTKPADPTKRGYTFEGWLLKNGTAYNFNEEVKENIELEADWKKEEYTVTFNSDGGVPLQQEMQVKYQELASEPIKPTKTDYVFKYWMDEDGNKFDFTTPITGNIILTAKWQVAKATFSSTDTGSDNTLNLKMKQIANPGKSITSGYNYIDTVTTAFKKATDEKYEAIKDNLTNDNIVSTSGSLTPIYMWFEEDATANDGTGTMYWYTEAAKVEFSGSMGRLFAKYSALTDISGFADFDTSKVTDMNRLFQNNKSLTNIDALENWDVSGVTSFRFAFGGAQSYENGPQIEDFSKISKWNVGNVKDFNQMFKHNQALKNLNAFKEWDFSSATDLSNMFTGTTGLQDASAIKDWNVVNVTNFTGVFSSGSGVLPYINTEKLPKFSVKPSTWGWTSKGSFESNP